MQARRKFGSSARRLVGSSTAALNHLILLSHEIRHG